MKQAEIDEAREPYIAALEWLRGCGVKLGSSIEKMIAEDKEKTK